ncbi:uncharacterized protein LOC110432801 [Sorghum bicolor]|uniref:uncharacterized protein LOC110432801 n=1 Tax=Sorghum bicolor TaxID=4558 RepID=UPI000B424CC2|nr:uncharacterized protein LOC110432801 [Sorghum bicolor]|eukprot:XP_021309310.1 uncharacterized protein LOC110432801 [Sorghum bicolor]
MTDADADADADAARGRGGCFKRQGATWHGRGRAGREKDARQASAIAAAAIAEAEDLQRGFNAATAPNHQTRTVAAQTAESGRTRRPFVLCLRSSDNATLPPLLPLPTKPAEPLTIGPQDINASDMAVGPRAELVDKCASYCFGRTTAFPSKELSGSVPGKSYLTAALTPPKPSPPPKSTSFSYAPTACFRCLAADHRVKDCRDPVRCRVCGVFGHMKRSCKLSSRWGVAARHGLVTRSSSSGGAFGSTFGQRGGRTRATTSWSTPHVDADTTSVPHPGAAPAPAATAPTTVSPAPGSASASPRGQRPTPPRSALGSPSTSSRAPSSPAPVPPLPFYYFSRDEAEPDISSALDSSASVRPRIQDPSSSKEAAALPPLRFKPPRLATPDLCL